MFRRKTGKNISSNSAVKVSSNVTQLGCNCTQLTWLYRQRPHVVTRQLCSVQWCSCLGDVVRIVPNIKKKTAVIHFSDHKGAKQAKKNGKIVNQSIAPIGHIFYCQSPPHSKAARKVPSDPEVKAELAGMSGGSQEQFSMKPVRPVVRKKVFSMTKALQSSAEVIRNYLDSIKS